MLGAQHVPSLRSAAARIASHSGGLAPRASAGQRQCRHFGASSSALNKASSTPASGFRVYRYVVDVHGQLFLHDTVPKNLTSCFKNAEFLDFFFKRIRPNPASCTACPGYSGAGKISRHDVLHSPPDSSLPRDWSDVAPYNGDAMQGQAEGDLYAEACRLGDSEGYEWISPCGPELNLVRCQDTPIVFRELSDEGMLRWAGTLEHRFEPDKLVVDASNGYVYHPSPEPTRRRRGRRADETSDVAGDVAGTTEVQRRYGGLSLLGSSLVLSRLAEGLEIDPDAFERGEGGSIAWQGRRYRLGLLG